MTDRHGEDVAVDETPHATAEYEPGSDERRRFRPPPIVILVAALLGLLGGTWTLASPIGAAPDDHFHLASIWCSPTAPDDACNDLEFTFAAGKTFVEIPAEIGPDAICYVYAPLDSAECQKEIDRGTVVETVANDGIYPPVYYALMGVTVGDEPVNSALLARLFTWVISIGLLAAGWKVLPTEHRLVYLAVLAVTAIPHGVFLWASTNPSGVVIASASAGWCAVIALTRARERRDVVAAGAVLAVATVIAAGSRSDGGLYLAIALVAAALLVWRGDRAQLRRMSAVGVAAAVALLVSFVVLTRRVQTIGGLVSSNEPVLYDVPDGKLWFNLLEIPWFITGNLGVEPTGWRDTPMPRLVWVPIVAVFFALVFRGISRVDRTKLLSLVWVLGGLLVLPYFLLWRSGYTVGLEVQPRYVLPLLPVLGYTALHRRDGHGLAGLTRLQVVGVLTLVAIAHATALHTTIRRYVTGLDVNSPNLDDPREWWWDIPITPNMVWVAGSSAFAALMVLLGRRMLASQTTEHHHEAVTVTPAGSEHEYDADDDPPYA